MPIIALATERARIQWQGQNPQAQCGEYHHQYQYWQLTDNGVAAILKQCHGLDMRKIRTGNMSRYDHQNLAVPDDPHIRHDIDGHLRGTEQIPAKAKWV